MRNVFAFLRASDDPELEEEFRKVYQEPNLRFAQIGFLLAVAGFGGFHLMDVWAGRTPAVSWAGAARLALTVWFAAGVLLAYRFRRFVVRYYTPLVNIFFFVAVEGAALLPLAVQGNRTNTEFYWSLNASLVTATIVVYGFSRLTARNTALVVLAGCATGASTVAFAPSFDAYYFSRLLLHLAIVNVASFSLRSGVERRERQLFLLAQDNLRKNVYARELEAARARAEEADQAKMRFLANMSHEFRTPMSGVVQTLEVVDRTATGETSRLVRGAIRSSHAFLETINGILNYTRWSHEGVQVHAAPVSLIALVRRVVARHRGEISRRGPLLRLRLDLTDSEDVVRVDEAMLAEVLGNLLGNAIKFTSAGEVVFAIELKAAPGAAADKVSIEAVVSDTGRGIPAESLRLLGTPFFQVDGGSDRRQEGVGLGLAIVSRLVAALGGSWTASSIEGKGSIFRVAIPAETVSSRPGRIGAAWRNPDLHERDVETLAGKVLLAEDNELNAALATDLLKLLGLEVHVVPDGRQAAAAVRDTRFDVVLMDCQMPVMDGYEATRSIRTDEHARGLPRVPIVAVTANALAGDREKCLAAGMDDHLAKPYTAAELREVLATWLPATHRRQSEPEGEAR